MALGDIVHGDGKHDDCGDNAGTGGEDCNYK